MTKKVIPVVNGNSFVETDANGNLQVHINCEYCGKPICKTSEDFGMDCEDDCNRKAYEKRLKTDPKARVQDKFLKSIMPQNRCKNDTKEEAFRKFFDHFATMEKELTQ